MKPQLNDHAFTAILTLFMFRTPAEDPDDYDYDDADAPPLSDRQGAEMHALLDREAEARGYSGWIHAYEDLVR